MTYGSEQKQRLHTQCTEDVLPGAGLQHQQPGVQTRLQFQHRDGADMLGRGRGSAFRSGGQLGRDDRQSVMLSHWPREAAQFRYMLGARMPAGWKMTHLSSLATNVVRADVQPVDIAASQLQQADPDPHPRMLGGGC
jgi:hypothetical protein